MNEPEIIIRDMIMEDIAAVSEIICSCYQFLGKTEGYSPDEISDLISRRGSRQAITDQLREYRFMVAEIDRRVVGALAFRGNEITKLYIKPDSFRKGIGCALFGRAEDIMTDQGYDNISLGAFPSGAKFYEAMGMKKESEKIAAGGPIKGRPILLYRKSITKH